MVEFLHGEIKDILPHNLLTPEIYSVSYAVGEAMRRWGRFCASVHLYAEISCVPEEVLDLMAIEMNTQYYDQSMNRKMKEQLIMQSLVWHLRAGTPSGGKCDYHFRQRLSGRQSLGIGTRGG